jgi:putative ABC transport system permease protein
MIFAKGAPADKDFFGVFNFPFKYGNATSAFENKNSIVLTEKMSTKLFGESDPLGQKLEFELWGQWRDFEVTGVINDIPANSSLDFEMLFPISFLGWDENNWLNGCVKTFISTVPGTNMDELAKKIALLNREHNIKATALLSLQPLTKVHLYNLEGGGRITYVYLFSAIAIAILIISCINFVNLVTAYSGKRMKEVGVKKVMGASRGQLRRQFLLESVWFALFAFLLALFLVRLGIPLLNKLASTEIQFQWFAPATLLFLAVALFTGVVSGIYPSIILSSSSFTSLAKGGIIRKSISGLPSSREILVGFQFLASIMLIAGAITIHKQLSFIKNKDLGFNKEHIIKIALRTDLCDPGKQDAIKQELLTNTDILSVTACNSNFTNWQFTIDENDVSWEGKEPNDKVEMEINAVDFDYLKTFGMKMADGRFFSKESPTDQNGAVVLNQAAVEMLSMQNPVGRLFNYHGTRRIIGVVKDFNFVSLHEKVNPLVLTIDPGQYHSLYIKVRGNHLQNTLHYIEQSIRQAVPDYPFAYSFLDDNLNKLYQPEQSAGNILSVFSMFAIIISCLGILGLIIFIAERRTKEIGIRKVNGATIYEVMALLNRDFVKWVAIAFVIATPIAYYAMNKWLENFAYKTTLSWWIFALAGLLALGIALLTVSWQSWKAATRNPVEVLRNE